MSKIKCWICGGEATKTRQMESKWGELVEVPVSQYSRCYCERCAKEVAEKEKKERDLYIHLKKREMFLKACNILESQHTDMYAYREAIDVVEEFVDENPDKFDSSYEVLAAIILVQNRIYCKMQYKVGPYQVDFLLPDDGIVLEIDGERHQHRKEYDSQRDRQIKKELGQGWDIIRIKTDYLDKNAKKLPDAINKVIDYRETGHINWRSI